ncbi:TonB-dependent receptor [Edaphobacter bradus]|uniref:TonB-dependent receptor n=1 Tax=Edaphobacter bradus TaxID=2259016 RepID=UPI0021E0A850|nr:TonB-dependent receptor [Edaphobacter bradus]
MNNLFRLCRIFLAILILSSAGVAMAQLDTGSVQGTVRDSSGAVIPNATVVVTNEGTQRNYRTTSNSHGEYSIPTLPVGIYSVTTTSKGFQASKIMSVPLNASELHRTDVVLQLGSTTDQITVTSDQVQVNTLGADLGTTIDASRIANLPLNGRDFTDLLALVPGSVTSGQFGQTSLGGAETSFAGVNILLDGADATRIDTNATSMQLGRGDARITRASVDSIAEFHILQGNFSAEYGRSIGDVVNVITKSGTNDWHGEAFEFLRNNALDARNYFAVPGTSTPLRLNQFGGNLGGPIVHQKLFFFTNYEGVRQTITNTQIYDVLNAANRARFVPSMKPVVAAIPVGNLGPDPADTTHNFDLYSANLANTLREDTGSVRIDWNPSETNKFYVRYNIGDSFTNTTYGPAVGQTAPTPARTQFLKLSNTHTFSATLLNEAGFGINSNHVESYGGGGPFPVIAFSCFFCNFGAAPGPATFASIRPQTSYQYIDTLTKVSGRQVIKVGADIRHNLSDEQLQLQEFLSYASISDFENNKGFAFSTLGNPMTRIRNTNYDFFVQDDVRLARTLTLNLGLRYEYNTVLHEKNNQLANFDIATQTVGTPGAPLYKPDYNNFAPRIGFSWDPYGHGKTVVRGGFGIFYNPQLTGAVFSLTDNTSSNISVNVFQALFGTVSCTPNFPLSYPVATVPVCTPQVRNVDEFDPNTRDSYALHYSFGLQQEVAPNTVLEVTYAADRGIKLPAGAAFAGLQFNSQNPITGTYPLSQKFANERLLGDYLDSKYNSLQVALRGHSRALTYDVNYTLAHEFDDTVSVFGAFVNPTNPRNDFSTGDIDVRNNFTADAFYHAPDIRYLPRILGHGWDLGAIASARSGLPVNIVTNIPDDYGTPQRPNFVPGATPKSLRAKNYSSPNNQFDGTMLTVPVSSSFGNVPRNAGTGPRFAQVDTAFIKRTPIGEKWNVEFRTDLFNIANHPNFANPSGNAFIANPLYGQPGQSQYALDPGFGRSRTTVGSNIGTGTSRQVQFSIKIIR